MAGRVVVSTLNNDTGVLATQNGMTGIAKAWVSFQGASGSINSSFNISSVTRNGSGDFTFNFTTAMSNTSYCYIGQGYGGGANYQIFGGSQGSGTTITTGSLRAQFGYVVQSNTAALANQDPLTGYVAVYGA